MKGSWIQISAFALLIAVAGSANASGLNIPERTVENSFELSVSARTKYPRTLIGVSQVRTMMHNARASSLIPRKAPKQHTSDNNGDDTAFDLQMSQQLQKK